MRSALVALSALVACTYAQCSPTLKDPKPAMLRCGLTGVLTNTTRAERNVIDSGGVSNVERCAGACLMSTEGCKFFTTQMSDNVMFCTLYSATGERMGAKKRASSAIKLYNINCFTTECPTPTTCDPINFLANSGFEDTSIDGTTEAWTPSDPVLATFPDDSGRARIGSHFAYLNFPQLGGVSSLSIAQDITSLDTSQTYDFTGYISVDGPVKEITVSFNDQRIVSTAIPNDGAYQLVSGSFKPSTSDGELVIKADAGVFAFAGGQVDIDDVTLMGPDPSCSATALR